MKVFLAGATGAVGKRLVPMLVAAGHEVAGMTRTPEKAERATRRGRRTRGSRRTGWGSGS